MGFSDIVALVTAFFQFPQTILAFVKILKKTPEENHDAILKRVADEAASFEQSGRPNWG